MCTLAAVIWLLVCPTDIRRLAPGCKPLGMASQARLSQGISKLVFAKTQTACASPVFKHKGTTLPTRSHWASTQHTHSPVVSSIDTLPQASLSLFVANQPRPPGHHSAEPGSCLQAGPSAQTRAAQSTKYKYTRAQKVHHSPGRLPVVSEVHGVSAHGVKHSGFWAPKPVSQALTAAPRPQH